MGVNVVGSLVRMVLVLVLCNCLISLSLSVLGLLVLLLSLVVVMWLLLGRVIRLCRWIWLFCILVKVVNGIL